MAVALRGWWTATAAAVSLLLGGGPQPAPAQSLPRTHLLIVSGASGEPRFATQFHAQAMALRGVATARFGIPDSLVTYLAESTDKAPGVISGRSTKPAIGDAIDAIARRAAPGDAVLIFLLGHGSSDGKVSRFNIPGADITDADLAVLLSKLSGQVVAVVNATSASGDFVKTLSAPNRVIITATKSGFEGNETLFATHFVKAYAGDDADADKDGRVSLLEAFAYARREVQREYEDSNRLQTEHAMLDDDGDGMGHADPGERGPDGLIARRFFLQPAVAVASVSDPRATALLARQATLQAQIDSLRVVKASMTEDAYQQRLEDLLLALSETAAQLRALGVKKP